MSVNQQPQSSRPSRTAPGAMTMAMQAVKTVSGPKVLRIGVIQGGKITEERIIRTRDTVTVGTTEKNTFTIPAQNFPATFQLFPMVGGVYKLNFIDGMEGRIAMPQGVQALNQLKESGAAQRSNIGWQITLAEQCRGKVSIGDVTFLFQFVAPPPPQPKPQLPAAIRAGWVKNIDWTYNSCLAFFLVLFVSAIAYVEYIYDPEIEDNFSLDVRTVSLVTPPAVTEPEPQEQAAAESAEPDNTPAPQAAERPQERPAPQTPEQRERERERQTERATAAAERAAQAALNALQNSAEFAALTGATDTGAGSAADRLARGGLMQGSVDALANTGGVTAAAGGAGVRRTGLAASAGGVGSGGLGRGGAIAGGGADIGTGQVRTVEVIRGRADVGGGSEEGGEGQLDASRVAGVLRTNIGGIRSCYERALRNNPTLAGRLSVRFTIGTSGRVTSISTDGLGAAPEVGSCIGSRIRSLVFPAPNGGSVDFSFPFNFAPGS